MKLTFLGTSSANGDCPSVYATDKGTYVVQGWKVADGEALSHLDIPDHETVIEIPAELLRYMPAAPDA
jgi:hypothetical protein